MIGQTSERRGLIKSVLSTNYDQVNKSYGGHVDHVVSNNKFDLNLNK